MSILRVNLSKAPWTKLEDEILTEIMKVKTDKKPWREVAAEVNQKSGSDVLRTGKQCRERWSNHLDPNINRGAWTEEEDMNLLKVFLQHGKKWSEIAKVIDNRTENAVKNRFNSLMKKYQKDITLGNSSEKKDTDEDAIWERRIAAMVLSSSGYNPNNAELETKIETFSNRTSNSEQVYVENGVEHPIKRADSDTIHLSKVSQKKNLLKSIIQQEPAPSFKPTKSVEEPTVTQISNGPMQNFQAFPNMYPSGPNPNMMTNQFVNNFGTFAQSYPQQQQQYPQQQQQYGIAQPQFQPQGMPNYYGGFNTMQNNQGQGFMDMNTMSMQNPMNNSFANNAQSQQFGGPSQFMPGSNFNYFSNPLPGGPSFSSQRPLGDAGQPLNSNNILSSNTINFPMSSPSILRTSNNPFFTAPTFPVDSNPFKNTTKSSNSFSDDSKDMKDSSNIFPNDAQLGFQVETPQSGNQAKPQTEIKREFIEKSLNEFNPETMIKPNSNKLMFAVVDYEKNFVYPINPVTFENYKPVLAAAKSNLGRDSLFASPLSLSSDFASPQVRGGNMMEYNNITKLNNDFASLAINKHQNNAQQSPSLRYLNSLLTGRRVGDSPDSFMSLRSPTLLSGSLSRRPVNGQVTLF